MRMHILQIACKGSLYFLYFLMLKIKTAGVLTSSNIIAAVTQVGLEVSAWIGAWLGRHSHDQGKNF